MYNSYQHQSAWCKLPEHNGNAFVSLEQCSYNCQQFLVDDVENVELKNLLGILFFKI